MVQIKKAILHVLDTGAGLVVDSQLVLDEESNKYLGKLLTQLMRDPSAKTGKLAAGCVFGEQLQSEAEDYAGFLEHSRVLGQAVYEALAQTDDCEVYDFVLCEFVHAERSYTALLMLPNLKSYAHRVVTEEQVRSVQFRVFKAFLPLSAQKVSDYLIFDAETGALRLKNGKRARNGEAYDLLAALFCAHGTAEKSQKESVKTINSIIEEVTEYHGASTTEALNRAKLYMLEHAEEAELAPQALAQEVFADAPMMQEAFCEKAKEERLPESVPLERSYAERVSKVQKIRTDTGIEISIPAQLLSDPEIIEFINNEDGTISIEIKNVEKLVNR